MRILLSLRIRVIPLNSIGLLGERKVFGLAWNRAFVNSLFLLVEKAFVASIRVSLVCNPIMPNTGGSWFVINRHGSYKEVVIPSFVLWWPWYMAN